MTFYIDITKYLFGLRLCKVKSSMHITQTLFTNKYESFVFRNIVYQYGEHQELHRKQAHNQDKSDYSSVTLQIFS